MKKETILITLASLVLVLIAGFAIWRFAAPESYSQIASYDACAAAGYPILETYPEQCRLPDGRMFIRDIDSVDTATTQPDATSTLATAAYGKPFTLRAGNKAIFPDSLTVTLKELNDSRCKPGVQCIWQGEIAAVLSVKNGSLTDEIILGTVNNKSVSSRGRLFTLQSATPETATIVVSAPNPASGSISGYLHTGPTCPVERDPPDPGCGDRPYANATVTVKNKAGGATIATAKSDASGNFRVTLAPGTYVIEVPKSSGGVFPVCESKEATVRTGETVNVDISCDSGIR